MGRNRFPRARPRRHRLHGAKHRRDNARIRSRKPIVTNQKQGAAGRGAPTSLQLSFHSTLHLCTFFPLFFSPVAQGRSRANRRCGSVADSLADRDPNIKRAAVLRRAGHNRARSARSALRDSPAASRVCHGRTRRAAASRRLLRGRSRGQRQGDTHRTGAARRRSVRVPSSIRRLNVSNQLLDSTNKGLFTRQTASNRLLVSTKKGLFTLDRGAAEWRVSRVSFLAENVTLAHADPRDGGWFAALNLGHFGVKLKFSPDAGATWEERAAPAYPEGETIATADGKPPAPATLKL